MGTTLLAAEVALSKEIGDYWAGTTTSAGSSTTVVDTALMAKANDWITDEAYDFITSTTCQFEERKISTLVNTTGILTVLAHSGTGPGTAATYSLHRLFSPSEKNRALVSAAKNIFPSCFDTIWDESLVSGNWLKDGSFEMWSNSTTLTYWTATTVTATQTTTSPYYKHGGVSCRLSGTAGTLRQGITNNDDLKRLAGKAVTLTVQAYSTTATLRASVYDGTTYTYTDYHAGNSAWTEDNDPLECVATISDNPTEITVTIHYASGTAYIDDARLISGDNGKIYIGGLGLVGNRPHQVLIESTNYSSAEPWILVRGINYDTTTGYMYLPTTYSTNLRLRIRGIGLLDFYASGASSTAWTASIALDPPQLDILVAEAAYYLYSWMSLPNYETGTRTAAQQSLAFWSAEASKRKAKYGMRSPSATVHWGLR